MTYFLKRILVFSLIPILLTIVFAFSLSNILPAPKISNRYSFNEKAFHFDDFEADYLCIGSSMALNNFNSEEVVKKLSSKNYFNFACWGVKPKDNYALLNVYLSKYNPKCIFFVSNVMDFLPPVLPLHEDQIKMRLLYPYNLLTPFYYLRHLDLKYYSKYFNLNKQFKSTDTISQSMKFDDYGGVKLVANEIPYTRSQYWNDTLEFSQIFEENYDYLEKILILLASKKINFIFIQTPLREGLVDEHYTANINNHNVKVKSIISKYSQLYINATEKIWPDTMFFDYGHFNEQGAKIFTDYCLNRFLAYQQPDTDNYQNMLSKKDANPD